MNILGKKSAAVIAIPVFFFLTAAAFAQVVPVSVNVTGLGGEPRNNLVRLNWTDSPTAKGPVYIYRSNSPFLDKEAAPSTLGRPVVVPYGVQSYIDETEGPGTYYYFAAASDQTGRPFLFLVPPDNCINVSIEPSPEWPAGVHEAPAVPPAGNPARPAAAGLSGITAKKDGASVTISFLSGPDVEKAILYRGLRPVKTAADLLSAVIIEPNVSSPFTDYPVPGIPYYYALVNERELVNGSANIIPGRNATVDPVEVPLGQDRAGLSRAHEGLRVLPLPLVSAETALPALSVIDETKKNAPARPSGLGGDAAKALESIPAISERKTPNEKAAQKKEMTAEVFKEDLEDSSEGEKYILGAIVKGPFSNREWKNSANELFRFLALPRSAAAAGRAKFYLGQCYYFSGMGREALFEFLGARSEYPDETAPWIKATLEILTAPPQAAPQP